MALKRLNELSKGDAIQAINIINHAILKSWDTFWALPKNHTNNDKGFKKDNFTTDGLSDFIKNKKYSKDIINTHKIIKLKSNVYLNGLHTGNLANSS